MPIESKRLQEISEDHRRLLKDAERSPSLSNMGPFIQERLNLLKELSNESAQADEKTPKTITIDRLKDLLSKEEKILESSVYQRINPQSETRIKVELLKQLITEAEAKTPIS